MSSTFPRRHLVLEAGITLAVLAACSPLSSPPPSPSSVVSAVPSGIALVATVGPSSTPPVQAHPVLPSAIVTSPVRVLALGNVYIRRGPDLAFNSIAYLSKGAVVTATGRNVLSSWLRVSLPEDSSRIGWISIMSEFTDVRGDLDSLPEIDPQEWPELASVRNCTYHELWVEPAGLSLPPVYEFPNNDLRLNPGTYSILDTDVEGYPEVLKVDLREGVTIEVLVDGLGEKKKCPPP